MKLLVTRGANVNGINPITKTSPLIEACRKNFFEGVNFLLENGADISYANSINGEFALQVAAMYANEDVINRLLSHDNVDIFQTNSVSGRDAITSARHRNRHHIVNVINRATSSRGLNTTQMITIELEGGGTYAIHMKTGIIQKAKDLIIEGIKRTLKYVGNTFDPPRPEHSIYELPTGFQFEYKDGIIISALDGGMIKYTYADGDVIFDEKEFIEYQTLPPVVEYNDILPRDYFCSICLSPFYNPYFTSCGSVYCKSCIDSILQSGIRVDPLTRKSINKFIAPCDLIRRLMAEYAK
jgi:hypothetical protein